MAVSALDPWTPATQPRLMLLCTLGNSLLMMPRLDRASLLMNTEDSSSTMYSRSLVVAVPPSSHCTEIMTGTAPSTVRLFLSAVNRVRFVSAGVNGVLSGRLSVRRPSSEDPRHYSRN